MASAVIARYVRRSSSSPPLSYSLLVSKRLLSSLSTAKSPPLPGFSRPVFSPLSLGHQIVDPVAACLNPIRSRVTIAGRAYAYSPLNHRPSFPGRDALWRQNPQVRHYSVKEMTKKMYFKDGNIRSNPKRAKFFKSRKGRVKIISYNDIVFSKYALQALEPGRIKPRQIQAARRAMMRIAAGALRARTKIGGGSIWALKHAEFRNGWGRGSPAYYVPVVKPGRILHEVGDGSENNQHIARTANLLVEWIQKQRAKDRSTA